MRLMSWLRSTLDTSEVAAGQREALQAWEYAQTNDEAVFDADPFKDGLMEAIGLQAVSPEEGFLQLLSFAERGSLYSANYVAWSYASGTGVRQNEEQALAWYRRAYEGGSERGLLDYGQCLMATGRTDEAETVYEAGWERSLVPAVYRLIRLRLRPTLPLADRLSWKPSLEWAAQSGHPAARFLLSKYLLRGWFGLGLVPEGVRLVCRHIAAIFRGDEDRPIAD